MRRGISPIRLLRTTVVAVLLLSPTGLPAETIETLDGLLGPGEIVYAVDADDRVLVDVNGDRPFIPASILKVFTTLLAVENLGLDTRFTTEFFRAGDALVMRGKGDPYLVSEELERIAWGLEPQIDGWVPAGIVVDNSFFARRLTIPGVGRTGNPYDAPNSATGVNFNTINVVRRKGALRSGEAQTPLTPLAAELAKRYKVTKAARINIGDQNGDAARYAGELVAAKLRERGIKIGNRVTEGRAPDAPPLYVHENSRTLAAVCRELLYHSNNYIANQVFLAVGARLEGPPASLEKGVAAAQGFIARHPPLRPIIVTEGSGLSYENRVTAPAMTALLALFEPYRYLLKEKDGVPHTTGTLAITRTLVGYLPTDTHGTVRFVIALDGSRRERRWDVVEALRQQL
jgi:D-alanyl-D-alanine carboxypeptidase/D-alanyl-D-alanine-endopeptidase (penicillin-binding protein 4)